MDTSRRKFFGIGAATLVVSAATSSAAAVGDSAEKEAIEPILLEHVCDEGKSRYSPEYIKWREENTSRQWGCGARFRWYFGVPPICPNCGWQYELTLDMLKAGFYKRITT